MLARAKLKRLRRKIMGSDRKYSVDDPDCYNDGEEDDPEGDDDDDGDTVAGDLIGEGIGIDEEEMEKYARM